MKTHPVHLVDPATPASRDRCLKCGKKPIEWAAFREFTEDEWTNCSKNDLLMGKSFVRCTEALIAEIHES